MNQTAERESPIRQDNTTPLPETGNTILSGYPAVMSLRQVAEALQISENKARQMCREKSIPSFKCGQAHRVVRTWLEEYMRGGGTHE